VGDSRNAFRLARERCPCNGIPWLEDSRRKTANRIRRNGAPTRADAQSKHRPYGQWLSVRNKEPAGARKAGAAFNYVRRRTRSPCRASCRAESVPLSVGSKGGMPAMRSNRPGPHPGKTDPLGSPLSVSETLYRRSNKIMRLRALCSMWDQHLAGVARAAAHATIPAQAPEFHEIVGGDAGGPFGESPS